MDLLSLLTLATVFLSASAFNATILNETLAKHGVLAVYPKDSTYQNVTQAFNRRFKFSPVAVAFPTNVTQVSDAVSAGAAQNLTVVARSGGHSYIANGLGGKDDALVVDLSKLKAISVHNDTALIETGNRLGDVALYLNASGRAMPHGTCSYVGIGGHSAYGGYGFTSRMWGLALDTVQSATVVLANGIVANASADVNPDLYWAIRGASPSFGIVTSIEVNTFPAPSSAIVFKYHWDDMNITTASRAVESFQTYARAVDSLSHGSELVFKKGAEKGKVKFGWTGAVYGNLQPFDTIVGPYLNTLPPPNNKTITNGSYIESVEVLSDTPLNTSMGADIYDTFYAKSLMTPESAPMSNDTIKDFVSYVANEGFESKTDWFVQVELYGGKNSTINAIPSNWTAFAKRDTLFTIQFYASSEAHDPPYPMEGFTFMDGMVNSILKKQPKDWKYGTYLDYIDDALCNATNWELYYGSNYGQLRSLKTKLDPNNTFSFPCGVPQDSSRSVMAGTTKDLWFFNVIQSTYQRLLDRINFQSFMYV
ncbi:glucooligosaccharide oxidase [Mycena galopus ATCC 62051]|nr:glucooligosaccharide oxidase [Mycena galopus ATCC 62051]